MKVCGLILALLCGVSQAKVVGTVSSQAGRIDLHDDAGQCVGQAKLAEFTSATGEKVGGCWVFQRGMVRLVFLDGDSMDLPPQTFKPPEGA